MAQATQRIAPLQDAVVLGIATDAERASLMACKGYRVVLNRSDGSNGGDGGLATGSCTADALSKTDPLRRHPEARPERSFSFPGVPLCVSSSIRGGFRLIEGAVAQEWACKDDKFSPPAVTETLG